MATALPYSHVWPPTWVLTAKLAPHATMRLRSASLLAAAATNWVIGVARIRWFQPRPFHSQTMPTVARTTLPTTASNAMATVCAPKPMVGGLVTGRVDQATPSYTMTWLGEDVLNRTVWLRAGSQARPNEVSIVGVNPDATCVQTAPSQRYTTAGPAVVVVLESTASRTSLVAACTASAYADGKLYGP